jgi:hypothetical protein
MSATRRASKSVLSSSRFCSGASTKLSSKRTSLGPPSFLVEGTSHECAHDQMDVRWPRSMPSSARAFSRRWKESEMPLVIGMMMANETAVQLIFTAAPMSKNQ